MALFLMRKWEDTVQRVQSLRQAVAESTWKLRQVEFTHLRPLEECLTDWAGLFAGLSHMRGELQGISRASVIAVALVGLKAVRVLNRVVDTALKELLKQQSFLSRGLFLYAAGSGWAIMYAYWGTITERLNAARERERLREGSHTGDLENRAEWLVQLIHNLKRLPAFFWYSSMVSCLVSLQIGQALVVRSMKRLAESSAGTRLLPLLGLGLFFFADVANKRTEHIVHEVAEDGRTLASQGEGEGDAEKQCSETQDTSRFREV